MLKKIVFMGTPFFSVPILKSLYQNGYPISVVYTQPPQKSQRGQKIKKSPIQGISETLNIECRTPAYLKDNKIEYEYLKKLDADIVIVVAYGQVIPRKFLSLAKKGFINIHASILPKWRGAAPIQRSIMKLEKKTGVSIMKIEEKLDSGPVCNTYKLEITDINIAYQDRGDLTDELLGRGFAWLDTGTHDSLMAAGQFVQTVEHRQGLKVACLEEIAFHNGWITKDTLLRQADALKKTHYGQYLAKVAAGFK